MTGYEAVQRVVEEVKKAVVGKDDIIIQVMAAIIADGHVLIDDIPGVGKTTMALAFAKSMSLNYNRVQFTPDVLPSDVTGFTMLNKKTNEFEYKQGAVMCNLFLADEINRTSPKTQSALLEVMEEGRVTVDGVSRNVPEPFIVMATQNPKGSAGTQLLPEAQLDRFMICMQMGYPDVRSEIDIAKGKSVSTGMEAVHSVLGAQELTQLRARVAQVYVQDEIYEYIVKLSQATRENDYIDLGISPRGSIACTRMAKARAFLHGRSYVVPEDVAAVYTDIAKHRLLLNTKARVTHVTPDAVAGEILASVRKPVSYKKAPV